MNNFKFSTCENEVTIIRAMKYIANDKVICRIIPRGLSKDAEIILLPKTEYDKLEKKPFTREEWDNGGRYVDKYHAVVTLEGSDYIVDDYLYVDFKETPEEHIERYKSFFPNINVVRNFYSFGGYSYDTDEVLSGDIIAAAWFANDIRKEYPDFTVIESCYIRSCLRILIKTLEGKTIHHAEGNYAGRAGCRSWNKGLNDHTDTEFIVDDFHNNFDKLASLSYMGCRILEVKPTSK